MVLRLRARAPDSRSCWPGFIYYLRGLLLQAAHSESLYFPGEISLTFLFKVPILFDFNWTGTSGYLQYFFMAIVLASLSCTSSLHSRHPRTSAHSMVDWYAVFFEACKDRSPSGAGVDLFGLSYSISLVAIIAGVAVKKTGKYLIPTYIGWTLVIVGAGLLTTLRADSSIAKSVGFQLVIGAGIGTIYVVTLFPILASIPVTQSAPAMALYIFSRNFGYVSLSPIFYQHSLLTVSSPRCRYGGSPWAVRSCRTS